MLLEDLQLQPFDSTSTGLPTYDDMMKDPEYFETRKKKVFNIVQMSPQDYIEQAYQGFKSTGELGIAGTRWSLIKSRSGDLVDRYADNMREGDKFPMPVLDYSSSFAFKGGRERGFSQEGLHRALAAQKLGLQKMPVMIVKDVEGLEYDS